MTNFAMKYRWLHRQKALSLFLLMMMQVPTTIAASLTLAWDEVAEPNVDYYELAWGSSRGGYVSTIDKARPPVTIEGLTEGQTYYFAVRACTVESNCSGYSNEVASTIVAPAPEPAAPTAEFLASPKSGMAPWR